MAFLRRNVGLNDLHEHVVLKQAVEAENRDVEFTMGLNTKNHVTEGSELASPIRFRRPREILLDHSRA